MKKIWTLLAMTLTAVCLLTACGGQKEQPAEVDLSAFYDALAAEYGWDDMMELDSEMLELYYPGLGDLSAKQLLTGVPMMSYTVSEYVFMECESTADAETAAGILQARIDAQSGGDAWYPETVEQWKAAKVITHGAYTAMIASGAHQSDIEAKWNELFEG